MPKQKDGRYRGKLKIGNGIDGKPVYKYASGRTKKELAANLEELKKVHITGNADARRDILFGVFAQEWYDAYKKAYLSPAGQASYAATFNAHLFPAFGDRQIRAITAIDIQKFLNSKRNMSKSSVDKLYSMTRRIFRAATAQYIIDRDPSLSLIKPEARENKRRALTAAETAVALRVGQEHPDGLLLLLLFYTGMRVGEAAGLKWSDINFAERTIRIERDIDFETRSEGEVKSEAAKRTIPMPDQLLAALNVKRGIGNSYILQRPSGQHLSGYALYKCWDRLMEAMYRLDQTIEHKDIHLKTIERDVLEAKGKPLPQIAILTPHYFRHNYASILYNADVDVLSAQKWIGHADVKTTLAIYSHLSEGKEDKNVSKLYAAFKNL